MKFGLSAEGCENGLNECVQLLLEVILCAGACDDLLTECLSRGPEVLALADGSLYCCVLSLQCKSAYSDVGVHGFGVVCEFLVCRSIGTNLKSCLLVVLVGEPFCKSHCVERVLGLGVYTHDFEVCHAAHLNCFAVGKSELGELGSCVVVAEGSLYLACVPCTGNCRRQSAVGEASLYKGVVKVSTVLGVCNQVDEILAYHVAAFVIEIALCGIGSVVAEELAACAEEESRLIPAVICIESEVCSNTLDIL